MGKVCGVFIDKITSKLDLETNTDKVLNQLKSIIINDLDMGTATKLLYWLNDWAVKYLKNEKSFKYNDLKYYERGNVVEAHFGFKVGSEHGGLHYAVVIENDNDKTNKTVVVVPLASLEDREDPEKLDKHNAFLGYDIFNEEIKALEEVAYNNTKQHEVLKKDLAKNEREIKKLERTLKDQKKKLDKYKKGTIALVGQMCALSKMRINFPKFQNDELGKLKLDSKLMDEIDKRIIQFYLNPKYSKN